MYTNELEQYLLDIFANTLFESDKELYPTLEEANAKLALNTLDTPVDKDYSGYGILRKVGSDNKSTSITNNYNRKLTQYKFYYMGRKYSDNQLGMIDIKDKLFTSVNGLTQINLKHIFVNYIECFNDDFYNLDTNGYTIYGFSIDIDYFLRKQ